MTVIVLYGHWDNHLHWHSSLYPDNSQLIYLLVGYSLFFQIGSKNFIFHHLASCLLCFSSALQTLFCFSSAPCILFCFSSTPCILFCFSSAPCMLFLFSFLQLFSLQILLVNLDVLWYDSHMFGVYGMEVRWYHFLFQLCTTDTAFCFSLQLFLLCILQGNLDVLWYDSHMLGMYGIEVRWYHFLCVFPLFLHHRLCRK